MPALNVASIGWDLDHAAVQAVEVDGTVSLARADAAFLAVDAVSQLWRRAVGEPVRSFRAATLEHEAWQKLSSLIGELRRLLARGGLLVCRLDVPSSLCRVVVRPSDPHFPPGSELNAYHAVATVHPLLATLAVSLGQLPDAEWYPASTDHPLLSCLRGFGGRAVPLVAATALPPNVTRLGFSATGHAVAVASDQVACLPGFVGVDPRDEARELYAAVRSWHERRTAAVPIPETPNSPAATSRPIPRAIVPITPHARVPAESLVSPVRVLRDTDVRDSVTQSLAALGFATTEHASADNTWMPTEVERLPEVLGQPAGYLLHGKLQIDAARQRAVTFFSAAVESASEADSLDGPSRLLIERARRAGRALVPVRDLERAVDALHMGTFDLTVAGQLRRSLTECVGLYRFELSHVIDAEEKAALLDSDAPSD